MRVNIWTGVSGTGKTDQMFKEIEAITLDEPLGSSIYIITPTQNTLQYERILTAGRNENLTGSLRAGVFSFQRFIWHIFNEIGGNSRETLSESGQVMLLHKLMDDMKDSFKYYQDSSQYIRFSKKVLDMLKEFRTYQVSVDDIGSVRSEKERYQDKLYDLTRIYENWLELIGELNIEDLNIINTFMTALDMNPDIKVLKDAVIYIDGFHNFTESEFQLIAALAKRVKAINILLTHKGENKTLFRKTDASITRLQELLGSAVNIVHFEDEFRRSGKMGLIQLEEYFSKGKPMTLYDGITITEAPNIIDEVTNVAREIERLTADGIHYREIGILYRDESYIRHIESIFRRFDISYHVDQKVPMHSHPFVQFIISVLECYMRRFEFTALMDVLKAEYMTGPEERDFIFQFENFALERGLTRSALFKDELFTVRRFRDGEGEIREIDVSDEVADLLDFKNDVLGRLSRLFDRFDEAENVLQYITIIHEFLAEEGIMEKVEAEIHALEETGDIVKRDETEQAFNHFVKMLDDAYIVFKEEPVSFEIFHETFKDGLLNAEFSLLPSTIDQVIIGNLDLAKVENKKHVFIIGMNRNVMPRETRSNALIREEEKELFEAHDIILSPSAKVLAQDERFVFYHGATRASEGLHISFSNMLQGGEPTKISPFVEEIIPQHDYQRDLVYRRTSLYGKFEPEKLVSSARSMEALIHLKLRELLGIHNVPISELARYPEYATWIRLYQIIKSHDTTGMYKRLNLSLTDDNRATPITPATAEALYGESMHASVSRFESFNRCQFQHFANYGLKLNVRQPYKVAPLDLGNLYHHVLENVTRKLDFTFQHEDAHIETVTETAIDEEAQAIQHGIFNDSYYNASLKRRAKDALTRLIYFMRDIERLGEYKIAHVELGFGKSRDSLGEVTFESDAGRKISLRGKIDRIDVYESGGNAYVNLIDYKSSTRKISRAGILNGLELQMITYMHVLTTNGTDLFEGEVRPNSMLFFPVKDPVLNLKAEAEPAEILKEQNKQLKPDGAFINEHPEYDEYMDESSIGLTGLLSSVEEYKDYSEFYPITVSAKGKINGMTKGRYFSPALFRHYADYVIEMYKKVTDEIYSGANEVNPMSTGDVLPCSFCDFKFACRVDYLMNAREMRENKVEESEIEAFEREVASDGDLDG
ncbi:PD-(D/E)XK nuclease family protein [Salinicoccus halitifaciens]|uniref:ATP-dependent helicase/nuclease subunit B n=1 Tax=Salinicoccus halitifaciens TaxID=1073415 RepID=A0ABV2ECN5_9STAP|nr:PD-(D/E)XK nuclease family protein [Salinicoccus halitifaciens]MCD2138663.1 PD-(D/E)XK nuclease family protein [Salinicoccus halitifaciens]